MTSEELYGHLSALVSDGMVTPRQAVGLVAKTLGVDKKRVYYAHHQMVRKGKRPLLGRPSKYFERDMARKAVSDSTLNELRRNKVSVMTVAVVNTLANYPQMINVLDKAAVSEAFKEIQELI